MALSITNGDVERIVRRYADAKDLTLTKAIYVAVEEAMEREKIALETPSFLDRLRLVQAMVKETGSVDPRSPDEIIGYDENGLPA